MKAGAVTIALLVVVAALAGAGSIALAQYGESADAATAADVPVTNASMGQHVSTFMQSSTGETSESVEAGMWDVAVENADSNAKADVVDRRIAHLRDRLDVLEERKQVLVTDHKDGSINEMAYQARMSRLVGEMAALNRSIEQTDQQARAVGVDQQSVEELRERADAITDEDMAAVAREMGGGPPSSLPGPAAPGGTDHPGETGPPDDGSEDCPSDHPTDSECPEDEQDDRTDEPPSNGPPSDGPPGDPPDDR